MINKIIAEIWKEMSKLQKFVFLTLVGLMVIGFFSLISCSKFREYVPEDGFIEEISEVVIERSLNLPEGVLDLSPGSPEK